MLLDELELAEKKEKQVLEGAKPTEEKLDLKIEEAKKLLEYVEK